MTEGVAGRSGAVLRLAALSVVAASLAFPRPGGAQVTGTLTDSLPAADSAATPDSVAERPYARPLPRPAEERLDQLTTASPETPGGMGLVAAGVAEAEIALEHARLAGRNPASLSDMQRHMTHVLHAIDPTEVGRGPGMGFGVVRAARTTLLQIEQVEEVDGLPGFISFHAPYVARAARGTLARAGDAVDLARRIQRATSATDAHRLVERLRQTVRAMAYGFDRDDDGRIGYTEDEMGLAQARYHLTLVERLTR